MEKQHKENAAQGAGTPKAAGETTAGGCLSTAPLYPISPSCVKCQDQEQEAIEAELEAVKARFWAAEDRHDPSESEKARLAYGRLYRRVTFGNLDARLLRLERALADQDRRLADLEAGQGGDHDD